jgi:ABC-2 type transport system permease protein
VRALARAFAHGFTGGARRLVTGRRYRVMTVLLLVGAWLSMDVYRDLVVRGAPVAVLDLDNSALSRTLRTFVAAAPELAVTGLPVASLDDAARRLRRGEVAAVVVIPAGLSRDLKRGRRVEVLVAADMSNILVGRNVTKAVAKAVGTTAAGAQLTLVRKLGEPKAHALARVVPITVADAPSFNAGLSYGVYVVPGLLCFLLHIYVLILGASVYAEPDAPAAAAARLGRHALLLVLGVALGLVLVYAFLPWVGIHPAAGPGAMALLLALLVAVDLLMAAAVAAVVPSRLLALEVTVLVAMLSMMLAGLTWPLDAFPAPLRGLALLIPFTPFSQALRSLLGDGAGAAALGGPLRLLGLQALVFGALLLVGRLGRRAARALQRRPA